MQPAVEIKNLSVTLGGTKVLKDISISLPKGGIIGLLGPTGSGKTTLIRSIVGRLRLSAGSVDVFGIAAGSPGLRAQIGYMTQAISVYPDLTVKENVEYFAKMCGQRKTAADEIVQTVEMDQLADRLVSRLSGGQKSRVSLAVALVGRPKLLVLDEPTVGLDPLLRARMWELFRQLTSQGATLLISSHVMDEATRCDHLLLLREGRVLSFSTPDELLKKTGAASVEDSFITLIEEGS